MASWSVRGGDAERHDGQLAGQLGDDLADGLGGAGGRGDDVLTGAAPTAPVLPARSVNRLLGGSHGVNGSHQTFNNAEVDVDGLGERGEAVDDAGGVGHHVVARLILLVVHTHDIHGRIRGGGGDDDLLGAALGVRQRLLSGGEDAGALHHILRARAHPVDVDGVTLVEDGDLVAVDVHRKKKGSRVSRPQPECHYQTLPGRE